MKKIKGGSGECFAGDWPDDILAFQVDTFTRP